MEKSLQKTNDSLIIIFTKVPIEGEVKTRLLPFITAKQATMLQEAFLKDIIKSCTNSNSNKLMISYTPENALNRLKNMLALEKEKVIYFPQKGSTFDERFQSTFEKGITLAQSIIIIGSDCPFITMNILNRAIDILKQPESAAIGFTRDGGFYLIGISSFKSNKMSFINLFSKGIESWQLIDQLNELKLKITIIEELADIDTIDDLRHAYIHCMNLKKLGEEYPEYTDKKFTDLGFDIKYNDNNRKRELIVNLENKSI